MCLNCGCGEPETRHQPTDITKDDLQKAADGSGISMREATDNMRASFEKLGRSDETPVSSSTAG